MLGKKKSNSTLSAIFGWRRHIHTLAGSSETMPKTEAEMDFHLEPRATRSQGQSPVNFRVVSTTDLEVQRERRLFFMTGLLEKEAEQQEKVEKVERDFARLGALLQNEIIKEIPDKDIGRKTKLIFVDLCMEQNEHRYCRPARLVSFLLGTPDELYDEATFVQNVVKANGDRYRDWNKISTADLFAARSDLVGSLHYFSPWGVECYAVFDIDASRGPEVMEERQRKRHVFLTNAFARKILYRYNEDLRKLYDIVGEKLTKCLPVFEKYPVDPRMAPVRYEALSMYQ